MFDLDGTLTVAQHDFDGIKQRLGLPADRPVLEGIALQPAAARAGLLERVHAWEEDLADRARATPGAQELLADLTARGLPIGVLTRNSRANARRTLAAARLDRWFAPEWVLGRDEAAPKPSPDGLNWFAREWGLAPRELVMVGDFRFDLEAGRAAGTRVVWLDVDGAGTFSALADRVVTDLGALVGWDGGSLG